MVSLSEQTERRLQHLVEAGRFESVEAVVTTALEALDRVTAAADEQGVLPSDVEAISLSPADQALFASLLESPPTVSASMQRASERRRVLIEPST